MDLIFVYKTSVNCDEDIKKIKPQLDTLPSLIKWNFDLEDCDRVFRVETILEDPTEITDVLIGNGFECEELPY